VGIFEKREREAVSQKCAGVTLSGAFRGFGVFKFSLIWFDLV
jgi:hypothetical protein